MASSTSFLVLAAFLALLSWQAAASDPSPLQDFCVVDKNSPGIMYFMIFMSYYCQIYMLKLLSGHYNHVQIAL
jgi:hypothetical protein